MLDGLGHVDGSVAGSGPAFGRVGTDLLKYMFICDCGIGIDYALFQRCGGRHHLVSGSRSHLLLGRTVEHRRGRIGVDLGKILCIYGICKFIVIIAGIRYQSFNLSCVWVSTGVFMHQHIQKRHRG